MFSAATFGERSAARCNIAVSDTASVNPAREAGRGLNASPRSTCSSLARAGFLPSLAADRHLPGGTIRVRPEYREGCRILIELPTDTLMGAFRRFFLASEGYRKLWALAEFAIFAP